MDLLCVFCLTDSDVSPIGKLSGNEACIHFPTDQDPCAAKIANCPHCKTREDCLKSGGSIFTVRFPAIKTEQ